jgi:hypothetical protein
LNAWKKQILINKWNEPDQLYRKKYNVKYIDILLQCIIFSERKRDQPNYLKIFKIADRVFSKRTNSYHIVSVEKSSNFFTATIFGWGSAYDSTSCLEQIGWGGQNAADHNWIFVK